jgi:predicted Ser/Thr protein kinase
MNAPQDSQETLPPKASETASEATLPPSGEPTMKSAGQPRMFAGYELVREIARGGMGVVYQARQKGLNRIVALKMILGGQIASDEDVRRFRLEAEAAANLDHPGIVPIYEVGVHDGQHFFSMGYIEGESLAALVARGVPDAFRTAELMRKVAEAVAFAHAKGVIHRDLKPANVLLDAAGEPKVTDFGLARRLDSTSELTSTGQILGTPSYMAPEQVGARSAEIGPHTDVYGLGATLYCLLTGRPPFQAASPMDTLVQVLEQAPVAPRLISPAVSPDLETICLKCLKKEPAQRYPSAGEVAAELARFLEGVPILAQTDSALSLAWRLLRQETRHGEVLRRWGWVWMVQAVLLLVLFLLTNLISVVGIRQHWPHVVLWTPGVWALAWAVWHFRFRGDRLPLTLMERQVAQVWFAFFLAAMTTGVLNQVMQLEPLALLPMIAIECGLAFAATAAIMGGSFYVPALACLGCSLLMALWPRFAPGLFGLVFSVSLFWPAWKHAHGKPATP